MAYGTHFLRKIYRGSSTQGNNDQIMLRRVGRRFSNTFSSNRKSVYLNISTIMEGYKLCRFMFSFHVDSGLDILFEKLTAQIGARLGLGTQLRFEAPSDLWVACFKIQCLKLG